MPGNANSGRRKPTALKLYEGSRGAKPQDLLAEPDFTPGIPQCPPWMPPLGVEYWQHITGELAAVPGLIRKADRTVLEQVCVAYHRWRTYEQFLVDNGAVFMKYFVDPTGTEHAEPKARPEARLAKEASIELARLRGELGLSPVARTRLHNPEAATTRRGLLDSDAV